MNLGAQKKSSNVNNISNRSQVSSYSNASQRSRQSGVRAHETLIQPTHPVNPHTGLYEREGKSESVRSEDLSQYSGMTNSTINRIRRVNRLEVEVNDLTEYNIRELRFL